MHRLASGQVLPLALSSADKPAIVGSRRQEGWKLHRSWASLVSLSGCPLSRLPWRAQRASAVAVRALCRRSRNEASGSEPGRGRVMLAAELGSNRIWMPASASWRREAPEAGPVKHRAVFAAAKPGTLSVPDHLRDSVRQWPIARFIASRPSVKLARPRGAGTWPRDARIAAGQTASRRVDVVLVLARYARTQAAPSVASQADLAAAVPKGRSGLRGPDLGPKKLRPCTRHVASRPGLAAAAGKPKCLAIAAAVAPGLALVPILGIP